MTKDLRIGKATKGMFINSVSFKFAFCRDRYNNAAPYFSRPSLLLSIVYMQSNQHDIFTGILKANHLMEVMANKQNLTANSHA